MSGDIDAAEENRIYKNNLRILRECPPSVIGALATPALDLWLRPSIKPYLTCVLCCFDSTWLLLFIHWTEILDAPRNLCRFVGLWHVVQFVPPIVDLLHDKCTDKQFFDRMTTAEWNLWIYYAPLILGLFTASVSGIWAQKFTITFVGILLGGAWAIAPREWRSKFLRDVYKPLVPTLNSLFRFSI